MTRLVLLTGPQGSGNHLFSRIFALIPNSYGWDELLEKEWVGHDKEPFATYWRDPEKLNQFDWSVSDTYIVSISCPYVDEGVTKIPQYKEFLEVADKYVDRIDVIIIGRDRNILEFQQERVRGKPSTNIFLKYLDILTKYNIIFVSQELLYLYRGFYISNILSQLSINEIVNTSKLSDIIAIDMNQKYIQKVGSGYYDEMARRASKIGVINGTLL